MGIACLLQSYFFHINFKKLIFNEKLIVDIDDLELKETLPEINEYSINTTEHFLQRSKNCRGKNIVFNTSGKLKKLLNIIECMYYLFSDPSQIDSSLIVQYK